MKITEIRLGSISVPLRVPFKTALRTVASVEDIILEIHTDTGAVGYGEAPPTGAVTGHTTGAIVGALKDHIIPNLLGKDIDAFEDLMQLVQSCVHGNSSAKAAADMALWDLYGQLYKLPVYKLLGGDPTTSLNGTTVLNTISLAKGADILRVHDVREAVECVRIFPTLDVARLRAVREVAGADIRLRIDANQAWEPKQAVRILNEMQEQGLKLEFVEQPVKAHDIEGLKYVTEHSYVPVLADESVFSPRDAMRVLEQRAADLINIKLMKCGGIYNALKIAAAAEIYGVECMIGCMLEAKISVNAAVELACAKKVFTRIDLDGPVLCSEDPILGGARFEEKLITVSDEAGMGIRGVDGLRYLD